MPSTQRWRHGHEIQYRIYRIVKAACEAGTASNVYSSVMQLAERALIESALTQCEDQDRAAAVLGISLRMLRQKVRQYGIRAKSGMGQ